MSSNDNDKEHNAKDQDQRVLQLWVIPTDNIDQETTLPSRERAVNPDKTIVLNTPDAFQKVVTPQRMEILNVLVESAQPVDIKTLSRVVDRGTETVCNDVKLLSSHGVIEVTETDDMMTSYLPYDTVRVDVDFPLASSPPEGGGIPNAGIITRTPRRLSTDRYVISFHTNWGPSPNAGSVADRKQVTTEQGTTTSIRTMEVNITLLPASILVMTRFV